MNVREAMTLDVVSVCTDTPFRKIVELMTDHRISGLPVCDREGRIVGVVTEGDLIVKSHRGQPVRFGSIPRPASVGRREFTRRAQGCVAGELMTTPAITVEEEADLRAAARLLSLHSIGRLPVTKAGKLSGVLSRADVIKVFLRSDADIRDEIVEEIIGRKMGVYAPDVRVEVSDGVVTLRGTVDRQSTARVLAFHVDRVHGVTRVVNELDHLLDDVEMAQAPPPLGPAELVL